MEARFGENFANVRVRNDSQAHEDAERLDAKAYTVGESVTFSADRFSPHTSEGKRLLAHELAHVVQQRRGGHSPALDPQAPHESAADQAADAVVHGAAHVNVAGATGVGVAREPEDKPKKKKTKRAKKDDDRRRTPPVRTPLPNGKGADKVEITDPLKIQGVLGEVGVRFELYSNPTWNNLGGGAETSSSRISMARKTRWGETGGIDYLVENILTGRLVIGEQKALGSTTFDNATATTVNLEKNIKNSIERLRAGIKSGKVHPEEVENVENIIERLTQTQRALERGTSIPEEVVFELTSVGGKSTKIGKGYIDNLAKRYADKPEYIEYLLKRTFIRNPKLAKAKGRPRSGKVGTDSDPDIVPAEEQLTADARSELDRLIARKTPKEWDKQKREEKKAREQEKKEAREREKQAKAEERARAAERAKKLAEQARQKRLEELREAARRRGDPDPKTKSERRSVENQQKAEAKQAAKEAQKKAMDEWRTQRKQAEADAKAKAAREAAAKKAADTKVEPKAAEPAPTETAPKFEAPKPGTVEIAPKGITAKGAAKGALGVAGVLAGVSAAKDIINDVKEGHYLSAAGKTGLFGLSMIPEAMPPLIAFGAIMNYWGPRHEAIENDSFKAGSYVEEGAKHIPLLGRSETVRRVIGGIAASGTAVGESLAYTAKDMGEAVWDGAKTVGGLVADAAGAAEDAGEYVLDKAEDAVSSIGEGIYDWITD
jgi:hypothetical protein